MVLDSLDNETTQIKVVRVRNIKYNSLPHTEKKELINLCASISMLKQLINPLILIRTGIEAYQLVARQKEMSAVLFGEFETINAWVFPDIESAHMACKLTDIKMVENLKS